MMVSNCLQSILKNKAAASTRLSVDFYIKQGVIFAIAMAMGVGIVQQSDQLGALFNIKIIHGMNFQSIALSSLIYLMMNTRPWYQGIRFLWVRNVSVGICLLLLCLLAVPGIVLLNQFLQIMLNLLPPLSIPNISIQVFNTHDLSNSWALLSWAWWLIWAPIVAILIAKLSKNRSIRAIILGNLLLPLLMLLVYWVYPNSSHLMSDFINYFNQPAIKYFVSLIGMIFIIIPFACSRDIHQFIFSVVPPELDKKNRNSIQTIRSLILCCLSSAIFFMVGNLVLIDVLSFMIAIPCFFILLAVCFSVYKILSGQEVSNKLAPIN